MSLRAWVLENLFSVHTGIALVFLLVLAFRLFRGTETESRFRLREADRLKTRSPLLLPGVRIEGEPHEILGVREDAEEAEIQSAYRTLMKRHHPDRVGRPGTPEWGDAQRIASAIAGAKDALLEKRRGR